jgi:hypothetical protein
MRPRQKQRAQRSIDRGSFSVALHISDRIVQCHKEDVYLIVVGVVFQKPKMRLPTLIVTVIAYVPAMARQDQ